MSMENIEAELYADLSAIEAKREKLRETLDRLKLTPQSTKSNVVLYSAVDVRDMN